MTDPSEKEIIEPVGDYQCPQCGNRYFDPERIRGCFYCCGRSFCVSCRKRDSDPVTGETVDICNVCAEKIQEINDALKMAKGGVLNEQRND